MNFKNMAVGLCAAVMALTMLPAMPIEVQAAEAPTGKIYASHVDSSKFPHATGSPMDAKLFKKNCYTLTGKITFSKEPYPGSGGVPLNGDNTVFAIISGQDATIYSKEGGGVFAPINSNSLFLGYVYSSNYFMHATSYDFAGFDTSQVTDMRELFKYTKATNLDVSNFDTSKTTDMVGMFHNSDAINITGLSNFDTSKVTNMSDMFYAAKATSLDLSSFNTSKVTSMYRMFACSKAINLDLSNFDTSNVTNMHGMFSYSAATSLDLSTFDTSKVTKMSWMFEKSPATSLDLSSFDTKKVTTTTGMFSCSKATSVLCRTEEDMNTMKRSRDCEATGFKVKDKTINTNTIPINKANFPDDNFRNWILANVDGKNGATVMFRAAAPATKDGLLDNKEQQATGTIDVNTQSIKDLRGIEHFPNLKTLNASNNDLSELNISNNTKLESVDVTNNPNLNKVQANEKLDGKLNATVDTNTVVEYVPPFTKKNSGEGNNVPVTLKTVAHAFSVTVPTSLPISVAADGTISCADASACKIINNEEGPVDIKSVVLTGSNSWVIVPTSTAMESEAVNSKKLAMTVMGYETNNGGLNTAAFQTQTINGNGDFGIVYTAKLPTQTVESDKAPVANVVFTIGWHEAA